MTVSTTPASLSHLKAAVSALTATLRHLRDGGKGQSPVVGELERLQGVIQAWTTQPTPCPAPTTPPAAPAPAKVEPPAQPAPATNGILADDDLAKLGRAALETMCSTHGVRIPLGAGVDRLRQVLANHRDAKPTVQAPASKPAAPAPAPQGQHVGPVQYDTTQSEAQQLRARCRELGVSDAGTVDVLRARLSGAKRTPTASQTVKQDCLKVVPQAKVDASKPTPRAKLPETYKALVALGGDGVRELAKRLNVATDGKWADLCSRVWKAVQANGITTAPQVKADATPAPYPAGTVLVSDGKGGVRLATEADLWAALERLAGRKVA